jgi:cholesterol transport system auxiliary component
VGADDGAEELSLSVTVRPLRVTRAASLAMLALTLGGCAALGISAPPPSTFDLIAPKSARIAGGARGQLVVGEPTAIAVLDTEKIVVRPTAGEVAHLAGVQWSDRLPKLLQARIVQSFENISRIKAVGRPGDRLTPDYQLVLDVRAFNIAATTEPFAEVEIGAKIVTDKEGRVIAAKVFRATVPTPTTEGAAAVSAVNAAFGQAAADIVQWAARVI